MKELIFDYAREKNWKVKNIIREEVGSLPIPLTETKRNFSGNVISLHHIFHDTTGYSLPDAVRILTAIAETDLTERSINEVLNQDALVKSSQRRFFTLLNRFMFKAAEEKERYRPLEFFYRTSPKQISKFYRGEMNLFDKLIFFAGRPPVSIKKAINVIREDA
jgi:lycopene beta-cyclase